METTQAKAQALIMATGAMKASVALSKREHITVSLFCDFIPVRVWGFTIVKSFLYFPWQ